MMTYAESATDAITQVSRRNTVELRSFLNLESMLVRACAEDNWGTGIPYS